MARKYYLTTAITYTSGKPHIGNTYEIVLADVLARFRRAQGYDVFFQTGTDEHGEKNQIKAAAAGVTPQEFVDANAAEIKRIWDLMGASYDRFIRTTEKDHKEQVAAIFEKFLASGDIYKGEYSGWYCTPCESFWTESQLVDGKCPDCGREVKLAKEEAYFFRMSKYADALIDYYDKHPEFIVPVSRKKEMVNNFLKPGLQDLCVSRTTFDWGIKVKSDPKHVVYVWLDALTNYITGLGYKCDGKSSELFEKYWPADVHIVGKDIVRFHTIYWPIFLMALGLPLPEKVFGHAWLLQDGGKMSKSKGNVMYADDMAEIYGVDAVRYCLMSMMPYDNDGVIGWDAVTEMVNGELANVFGNLVNRTVAMCNKYFGGVVRNAKAEEAVDGELKAAATSAFAAFESKMEAFRVADALSEIMSVFRRANKYIDETAPWALAKEEGKKDRLATVLYNLCETIVIATSMLECFMPAKCAKVFELLGTERRAYGELGKFGSLPDGTKVADKAEILFARLDPAEINAKVEAMFAARAVASADKEGKSSEAEAERRAEISVDDFSKAELRVGKVVECEKVPKADKLLCSKIDVGEGRLRTVVSGIAKYYSPEQMVGKNVVLVSNLKPVKLRGILSEGMILCAEDKDGRLFVISPDGDVAPGGEVR
ncbi:MAG TPA: methionine--tRNA ligase [Candidatus Ornithoclostridium excrementipullorum]|nr:methionine--tRNA ligase [Candidatus Ornithoclostridium excrementipullorum]